MKIKLTKRQLRELESIAERLSKIAAKYADEKDVALRIDGNGTVSSNLDCARASIDTILQEYYN